MSHYPFSVRVLPPNFGIPKNFPSSKKICQNLYSVSEDCLLIHPLFGSIRIFSSEFDKSWQPIGDNFSDFMLKISLSYFTSQELAEPVASFYCYFNSHLHCFNELCLEVHISSQIPKWSVFGSFYILINDVVACFFFLLLLLIIISLLSLLFKAASAELIIVFPSPHWMYNVWRVQYFV